MLVTWPWTGLQSVMRQSSLLSLLTHQTWDSPLEEDKVGEARRERERETWPGSELYTPHTWHRAWAGPGMITLAWPSQRQLHHSFSNQESLSDWALSEVIIIIISDTSDPGHHHGATHQCRPRGLHPPGQDQHGGVHQEFENKVRLLSFLWMSYSSDEWPTVECRRF